MAEAARVNLSKVQEAESPSAQTTTILRDGRPSPLVQCAIAASVLLGAAALGVVLQLIVSRDEAHRALWLQFMLAAVAVSSSAWAAFRQWRRWSRPVEQLAAMIQAARLGEIPIEELSHVHGGMEQLVPMIQDLLRDVRSTHASLLELNEEIRQRVAVRTDKLERKIGSLKQQATKDALTGLGNRRMFDESLTDAVEKCRAEREELSLIIMDVDHFKLLNDTLGHAEGDRFLKEIGQLIRSTVRVEDLPFRLGGDEFVVLLPRCMRKTAEAYAQRLISLVDQLAKPLKLDRRPRISVGLSSLNGLPDPTGETLLRVADEALYEQKSTRRRRVTDLRNPNSQNDASLVRTAGPG
jgi:diguanylate cyclase (GGDEF)-like protein